MVVTESLKGTKKIKKGEKNEQTQPGKREKSNGSLGKGRRGHLFFRSSSETKSLS